MPLRYKHTILLVDDEISITKSLQRLFRKDGYMILSASSGEEGLDVIKNHGKLVSLIISDQRMPAMTGAQFLEKAKELAPHAVRFLLTGYSDMEAMVDAVNKGEIHRFFTKPWNDDDLLLQVKQALEQYELTFENRRLLILTRKQNNELNELNKNLEKKVEERSKEILEKNEELSQLNKELESGLYNTVRAFASLAEMHAPSLAGHGRRVSQLSRDIAENLDLSEGEILQIEIAALLHDIGKLGFPEAILEYKEEQWGPKEKDLFKRHPEEGQTIVRFIDKLDHVGLLIRSHHERFDGQGFPDRLKEEEIPLGSRIIALADAYDKMVFLRVKGHAWIDEYQKEMSISPHDAHGEDLVHQAATHHLSKMAFTLYDPDVVKRFLDVLKEKGVHCSVERVVSIENLREGMVLSKPLYTSRGLFLLPANTRLTADHVEKLKFIHAHDSIPEIHYKAEGYVTGKKGNNGHE